MDPNYFSFCPVLEAMISDNSATGRTGRRFQDLGALSTRNNLYILRQLVLGRRPENTLEIGLAFGGSALVFLSSLQAVWGDKDHSHVAIDPFQESDWDCAGIEAIERAGMAKRFTCISDKSCFALPAIVQQQRKFDLIYVDGSHLFEDVFVDMYYTCQLLSDGAIVVFDDCTTPHVSKVLKFVTRNFQHVIREVDLTPYRPAGSAKSKLARLLGYQQTRAFLKVGNADRAWDAPLHNF